MLNQSSIMIQSIFMMVELNRVLQQHWKMWLFIKKVDFRFEQYFIQWKRPRWILLNCLIFLL